MHCLKCGRERPENQVFCEKCLNGMSDYPVKPDTAISLPKRAVETEPKKQSVRKKAKTQEEQIVALSRTLRRMMVALLATILLLGICVAALLHSYQEQEKLPQIGRNYGVNITQDP